VLTDQFVMSDCSDDLPAVAGTSTAEVPKASRSSARLDVAAATKRAGSQLKLVQAAKKSLDKAKKRKSKHARAALSAATVVTEQRRDVNSLLLSVAHQEQSATQLRGGRQRCWCHQHYLAMNASTELWDIAVTDDNFAVLSKGKNKLVCSFCLQSLEAKAARLSQAAVAEGKPPVPVDYSSIYVFAWDPSTKRRDHLMLKCSAFKVSAAYQDPAVQSALDRWRHDQGKAANVCTLLSPSKLSFLMQ
jgi:hypothetical protein